MKTTKLHSLILIGPPASGKTTFALDIVSNDRSIDFNGTEVCKWLRISRDDFRYMYTGKGLCTDKIESLITMACESSIEFAFSKGFNVIVDATHCNEKSLKAMTLFCARYSDVHFKRFDVSLEECVERDSKRERKVGRSVIERMNKNLADMPHVPNNFLFKKLEYNRPNPQRIGAGQDAVIFDIDGTLAIMGDRSPFDWDMVDIDSPNYPVIDKLKFHHTMGDTILLVSGRDSRARIKTELWLDNNQIPYHSLYMRPRGDQRPDVQIKKEIYDQCIEGFYNVLSVYDDRQSVVKFWKSLGLFVFDVNHPGYEF